MKNENNLFICSTYYHILISLIKALKNNEKNTILICNYWGDRTIFKNKDFIERIINSNIFEKVYLFDLYDKYSRYININKKVNIIKKFFIIKDIAKKVDIYFKKIGKIYIFNDTIPIGRAINLKKIKYYLIEDGTDYFKKYNEEGINAKKNSYKLIKKKIFNLTDLGYSSNIINIEVNDKKIYLLKTKTL